MISLVGFSVLGLLVPATLETAWYWDLGSEDDHEEQADADVKFKGIRLALSTYVVNKRSPLLLFNKSRSGICCRNDTR